MSNAIAVSPEAPDQPEVLALLRQSDAFPAERYPPGAQFLVDATFLAGPSVRFLVARLNGNAVGCGALVVSADRTAEIKRMIVDTAFRKLGVGRTLLDALEATAKQEHVRNIRLETGPLNTDALALYRLYG